MKLLALNEQPTQNPVIETQRSFSSLETMGVSKSTLKRQTMLFSATQTKATEDLSRVSLKKTPIYVSVDENKEQATVEGLEQGFVVCPSEKKSKKK